VWFLWIGLLGLLTAFALLPMLLPLVVPVLGLMCLLWKSRDMMTAAVSQLAEEAAAPFGMTRVQNKC
jgi:hypothetical protein